MAEPLADQIVRQAEQASGLYFRLVLVVAPAGTGKTVALQEVQTRMAAPLVNVNLELSRHMLDMTERQRALQVARLLEEITGKAGGDIVLLDNVEILFDVSLKQDPLRLLQGISRNRTVVATWNGGLENGHMTYATPGHPEHRRCPVRDFLVVAPEATT